MKSIISLLVGIAATVAQPVPAHATGWGLEAANETHGLKLVHSPTEGPSYLFECGDEVLVTERGVTELLDIQTNTKIEDQPGSKITPGASLLALYLGKGQPDLVPAEASPNSNHGWDLTIRLSKTDKQLRALSHTKMISLFTTGYTMAVAINDDDRKIIANFVDQCSAS